MIERGEIWPVSAGRRLGSGRSRSREVLVVQCAELLQQKHPLTLVIPLSTDVVDDAEPLRIRVSAAGRLRQDADLMIDQIFAIETARLVHGPLLRVDDALMARVEDAMREILGLLESG